MKPNENEQYKALETRIIKLENTLSVCEKQIQKNNEILEEMLLVVQNIVNESY